MLEGLSVQYILNKDTPSQTKNKDCGVFIYLFKNKCTRRVEPGACAVFFSLLVAFTFYFNLVFCLFLLILMFNCLGLDQLDEFCT